MLALVLRLFFLLHLTITAAGQTPPYIPTDNLLLNCGSSSGTTSNGRNWDGDAQSKFSPPNLANISVAARAFEQHPSVTEVPYMTARIFPSQVTFIFQVSPGPKFLRLYFYASTYSGFNTTQSFFTVTANNYTLLSNFSAFLTVSAPESPVPFLVKEFIVNVKDNQILNLTFSPSPNSFSFVNGVEIVSMPYNLYIGSHDANNLLKIVNSNSLYSFNENGTAFETLYRLNVGGSDVLALDDTGMFRVWSSDDRFILGGAPGNPLSNNNTKIKYSVKTPPYSAPDIVYTTARAMGTLTRVNHRNNLTWIFGVDSGFFYLLRLHFCEINPDLITTQGQRVFTIYISNRTAEPEFDVIFLSGGPGVPMFRDFVVWVPKSPGGLLSKQDLWLALSPSIESQPQFADAILNGLEIFKLNSSDANLAGPNPELVVGPTTPATNVNPSGNRSRSPILYAVIGGVVGAFALFSILGFFIFRRCRRGTEKDMEKSSTKSSWVPLSSTSKSTKTSTTGSSLPSDLCRCFLLDEIKSATANFNDDFVIGTGGFGNVYKGYIDDGVTTVAIKRLNPSSRQGAHEFHTEIEMLSKLRHVHLVSLIGYCNERGEMILVYDFMANGTLRDHLYKTENPPLPWKQRLQICIGAAKGLHYLHSGAKHNIIHRDVKSTNILLDEKWVAKVSDFGLSKIGPTGGTESHVSTVVKGSFGYLDPEYFKRQQLTNKSDVYSFGVVLFEVLSSRPAIIPNLSKERVNLAEWARRCYKNGTINQIVDPNLKGEIAEECLRNYAELAIRCLKDQGIERPAMNDIVWSLEFALQLQEAAEKTEDLRGEMTTTDDDDQVFSALGEVADMSSSTGTGTSTTSSDRFRSNTVFSQMMNPDGR